MDTVKNPEGGQISSPNRYIYGQFHKHCDKFVPDLSTNPVLLCNEKLEIDSSFIFKRRLFALLYPK